MGEDCDVISDVCLTSNDSRETRAIGNRTIIRLDARKVCRSPIEIVFVLIDGCNDFRKETAYSLSFFFIFL